MYNYDFKGQKFKAGVSEHRPRGVQRFVHVLAHRPVAYVKYIWLLSQL